MRKLILKCGLSPGDIVMLTAAVRDLHCWYPGQFLTDVRTLCPGLWENNPHVTPLSDNDPEAVPIECTYPLIDRCNQTPYHCLHGFTEFLNDRLRVSIKPTAFKGDIHLSAQEKAWYSQVHEVTGQDTPFWIVAAGGKHDVTIKWWETERYQQVIDHFRGQVQFVQVGQQGHHHPKLDGVIDLRGQTSLRELVRLVHHSQGVLCSVTALMHLAAAVEVKRGRPPNRPCVVVAGGREPAYWEAYPGHQFIHTNGALSCCKSGGCWKDRTVRLRDGDERDKPSHRCVKVVNHLPRCMDMITPAEVIRRMETYFKGGLLKFLSPQQHAAAERGVTATANNAYDQQPLDLHSAGLACESFIRSIPPYSKGYQDRGIVICGGGVSYFTNAWVCINMLRRLGCRLPIQVWYLGEGEMDHQMKTLLAPLGVECFDAAKVRERCPARILKGWPLKPYSILYSPFREVLLLDADNVPVVNPEFLFDTPQFKATGAIFWPDYPRPKSEKNTAIWKSCGLQPPNEPEFESGQIVVDKQRCWRALCLTVWFNENSDFYYQYVHGDKETFHLAFRKLKKSYSLVPTPIDALPGTMCQHDFQGRRILQHRNLDKWDLFLFNRKVNDFWFEKECRDHVLQLRRRWDGKMGSCFTHGSKRPASPRRESRALKIEAIMVSCAGRKQWREQTLANFARTDWGDSPFHLHIDDSDENDFSQRRDQCTYLALRGSLKRAADYVLLLEDDLDFNRHIQHNLNRWNPLNNGTVALAGLFNPRVRELAADLKNNARIVDPKSIFGSQAFLIAKKTVARLVRRWGKGGDLRPSGICRVAAGLPHPVFYHAPSLVQHIGKPSAPGMGFLQAIDFHPNWRA